MFGVFESVDPSSISRIDIASIGNDRSEYGTYTRACMPGFDLLLCCSFIRYKVIVQASLKPSSLVIWSSPFLL